MTRWRPQRYRAGAVAKGISPQIVEHALRTAEITHAVNGKLPPILTLRHLAEYTGVDYGTLRSVARRSDEVSYRVFRIRKRPAHKGERRFRVIAVPSAPLMQIQRWINKRVLMHADVHPASVAFAEDDNIREAAAVHCQCKWLIKLDVLNFFESISEISIYKVFRSLGYQPLISFELSRICTRISKSTANRSSERWINFRPGSAVDTDGVSSISGMTIRAYDEYRIGHLPQGAPTSPMLANLAMRELDQNLTEVAKVHGLFYTRYADDLTFSTREDSDRRKCQHIIGQIYRALANVGLSPNRCKTRIIPPGGRKIVLGLLVTGPEPRLMRDFKARLRQHFYYLERPNFGPSQHARKLGFSSVIGFRHHLAGLVSYAAQIEPEYGQRMRNRLKNIKWPI
ncbi:RNA-directed DNA polymerase [Haliangium sp. UPWRP_2]|nr:RNA-directed DNA polymerase [Haliangium sp. UPWRP_2]